MTIHSPTVTGIRAATYTVPTDVHVGCATQNMRHIEYFHDHARLEPMLFEGTLSPEGGALTPDSGQAGHGLSLRSDAEKYRVDSA